MIPGSRVISLPEKSLSIMKNVIAWREKILVPTYRTGTPEKNPIFLEKRIYQGSSGVVYPHPVIEKIENEKFDKEYDVRKLRFLFAHCSILLPAHCSLLFTNSHNHLVPVTNKVLQIRLWCRNSHHLIFFAPYPAIKALSQLGIIKRFVKSSSKNYATLWELSLEFGVMFGVMTGSIKNSDVIMFNELI